MTWEPVATWETEQPMRCTICGEVYTGRELTYMPAMCDRDDCPGPSQRVHVVVIPAEKRVRS